MRALRSLFLRVLSFFTLAFAVSAFATPIAFIHAGTYGSGTLDGNPLPADGSFSITAIGDTDDRVAISSGWSITHISAVIDIAGVGSFTFITPTRTFVNQLTPRVGFSRAGAFSADLFNGPIDTAFATWDMLSSIGPFTGTADLMQWDREPVETSGGVLEFVTAVVPVTFQARVPEPGSAALVALGLALLGTRMRKQR